MDKPFYTVVEILRDKLKVEYNIKVDKEYVEDLIRKRLSNITQQIKYDGYRKGHAPESIIREDYGREALKYAVEKAVEESYNSFCLSNEQALGSILSSKIEIINIPADGIEGEEKKIRKRKTR